MTSSLWDNLMCLDYLNFRSMNFKVYGSNLTKFEFYKTFDTSNKYFFNYLVI